jgi:glycosyltransferase involved in cell wall biosynthesis
MSSHPDVSVIIPTYNRTGFLKAAVASALAQTLQDFEIIVVDDASQDDTEKMLRQFKDSRITLIRHEINQGVAAARNTGVMNSKGKYIAFLDDDDEWLPNKINRQIELLEISPKIVGAVYSGWTGVDAASERILYQRTPTHRGEIFTVMLLQGWLAPTSSFLVRKECFEKAGLFDLEFDYGEDFDMWLRIARTFQFDYIEEPLVRYSVPHKKPSLSANYKLMIRGTEAQLRKYIDTLALNRKNHSRCYLNLGVLYCYNGDVRKGRENFLKGMSLYPFEPRHYFNFGMSLLGSNNFKRLKMLKETVGHINFTSWS